MLSEGVRALVEPPERIDGYRVEEYGFFPKPILPTGYVVPPDDRPPQRLVKNLAICTADGVNGYYLFFCEPNWRYVTYCFDETLECIKTVPLVEFGHDVAVWHKAGRTKSCT